MRRISEPTVTETQRLQKPNDEYSVSPAIVFIYVIYCFESAWQEVKIQAERWLFCYSIAVERFIRAELQKKIHG